MDNNKYATIQVLKSPEPFKDETRSTRIAAIRLLRIMLRLDLKTAFQILKGEIVTLGIKDAYDAAEILCALGAQVDCRPVVDAEAGQAKE